MRASAAKRAGDLAHRDVATCRPDAPIGDVRARVASSGYGVCVVTNDAGVVFGVIGESELTAADGARADAAMNAGVSTFRPNVPLDEMATYMTEHALESAPITSSDGRLIGLLLREDATGN